MLILFPDWCRKKLEINILHNRRYIYNFLKTNQELQIYCIGDLDDFFWSKTIWYALTENSEIKSIALLYTGMEIPTLLSFYSSESDLNKYLLEKIKSLLPLKFYAHLCPALIDVFGQQNIIAYYGLNLKMALKQNPADIHDDNIKRLSVDDLNTINEFYAVAYPDNWFDKRMLDTNQYFGYFTDNNLVGIAGVHVYSPEYKVAALGNIAVHPNYRGQHIAFKLTSKLCFDLKKKVDSIGLNVKSDNLYAISCYQKIGFEVIGKYDECLINNK